MSKNSKSYFIVFDKEFIRADEALLNVNFFYLKHFKKKKGSLSFVSTPFLRGIIHFGLDMKDRLRPIEFIKKLKDGSIKPLNPKLFRKLLISENNKYIAFSRGKDSEDLAPILELFQSFQFDDSKIIDLRLCELCLKEKRFTILDESNRIQTTRNRLICPNCALDSVIREATLNGLISGDKVDLKFKNFFNHMILKFKNTEKVLSAFKSDFNPAKHRDITIYDIEKSPDISIKYLDYSIENVEIPQIYKELIKDRGIYTLLPIQAISIDRGLLSKRKNQLIMAPTSGGKTLVGELAGISQLLENKNDRMLYLVPIVALANVRTEEFKKKYKTLGINIIKKVGESLLDKKDTENLEDLMNAEVIVATYEAIDYILRSGNGIYLGNIKTIIIDEVQTLIDPDRGFILDGLISRLKYLYDKAQFIYLSATLGEPELLAEKLECSLIRYLNRPVPIERHLILCLNEQVKHRYILKLTRSAFYKKSKFGFKGQTIIFTHARKKCESLTAYLLNAGVNVRSYHSGLTHEERKIIEEQFQEQKIAGVVATAALAAGVDFPASQVIFESLAMGIYWLTVAEFEQMLGRAGRLKKHELGLAYLLVEPGKTYNPKMKVTEENIAIKLLNGKIKDFELPPDDNKSLTELLAFFSMHQKIISNEDVLKFYDKIINNEYHLFSKITKLKSLRLIEEGPKTKYSITNLGRAIAKSFLTVDKSLEIIGKLNNTENIIIDIVLELKPIKNVYITKDIVADLSKNVNMKYFSNNFFSASVLSLMNAEYIKKRKKFSQTFIDLVLKWTKDIFKCKCNESPYCDCGRLNLEKIILSLRTENKFNVEEICTYLEKTYKILIFKGDLIDYLENLIYTLESIKNIIKGVPYLKRNYKVQLSKIPLIIDKVKNSHV
ncbi:MAG: DEAD/DEAH box helicase [Promethearchaeota archaeon]